MQPVEMLLKVYGPALSSTIAENYLCLGVTREAARKRISRAGGNVRRLEWIHFPNRERFLFLNDQFGSFQFRETLEKALIDCNTSYGRALNAIKSHGGAIPELHFPIAAGLPVENTKGQLLADLVLDRLLKVKLLTKTSTPDGDFICLWNSELSERRRASLIAEDVVLGALKSWMVKINWTSPGAIEIRSGSSAPKFGQFRFDLVGPSYLNCIRHYKNQGVVNGFIFADILLDREITTTDLVPFFAKWDVLTYQKRATRFQPIFIADLFTRDALNALRERGAVVARPETIFGSEVAKQLSDLIRTIEHAAAAITNDPQAVFALLKKMTKVEGAALNLRGVVLELMVAHIFKLQGYQIDIRQRICDAGGQAEIDVKATNRREVVCIECKGKAPGVLVDAPEIERWIDTSVSRIKGWLKVMTSLPNQKRFEFYSSTGYTTKALTLIEEIKVGHKSQPVRFFDGSEIVATLREHNEQALVEIFREQFLPK